MTTVYLLRHGVLLDDSTNRFIGQTELPLADAGVAQAEALARALADKDIAMVHCSSLRQSLQTARIIGERLGLTVSPHEELREVGLGEWEGKYHRDVAARWPDQFASRGRDMEGYRPPGGESFSDCLARVWPVWKTITKTDRNAIAVVGEASANRLILCRLLGMPLENLFRLGQDCGCINIIQRDRGKMRVRLVNGHPRDIEG